MADIEVIDIDEYVFQNRNLGENPDVPIIKVDDNDDIMVKQEEEGSSHESRLELTGASSTINEIDDSNLLGTETQAKEIEDLVSGTAKSDATGNSIDHGIAIECSDDQTSKVSKDIDGQNPAVSVADQRLRETPAQDESYLDGDVPMDSPESTLFVGSGETPDNHHTGDAKDAAAMATSQDETAQATPDRVSTRHSAEDDRVESNSQASPRVETNDKEDILRVTLELNKIKALHKENYEEVHRRQLEEAIRKASNEDVDMSDVENSDNVPNLDSGSEYGDEILPDNESQYDDECSISDDFTQNEHNLKKRSRKPTSEDSDSKGTSDDLTNNGVASGLEANAGYNAREQIRKRRRIFNDKTADRVLREMAKATIEKRMKKTKKQKKNEDMNKNQKPQNEAPSAKKGKTRRTLSKKEERANSALKKLMESMVSDTIADAMAGTQEALEEIDTEERLSREKLRAKILAQYTDEEAPKIKGEFNNLWLARRQFPKRSVKAYGQTRWQVKGLKTQLMHHQLLGSAEMIFRENETTIGGGINADEMGFGKTIQTLATMVGNPPDEGEPKATLVVCPSNLVEHWMREADEHIKQDEDGKPIWLHTAANRIRGSALEEQIRQAFCIITTYDEVRRSANQASCPKELVTEEQISDWYQTHGKERLGLLHRVHFRRIVLDECTAIKNYRSTTALACNLLSGEHRWLLSGTPLVNSIKETYSYLIFLRSQEAGSMEHFINNFVKSQASMQRLQELFQKIMIRRTYKDRIFEKRLFSLPRCYRIDVNLGFLELEQALYSVFVNRACDLVNIEARKFYRTASFNENQTYDLGAGSKNPPSIANILVFILRLRQMVSHPLLIGETMGKMLLPKDRDEIREIVGRHTSQEDFEAVKMLRRDLAAADAQARSKEIYETDHISNGGDFGRSQISGPEYLDLMDELARHEDDFAPTCVYCGDVPQKPATVPMETSCGHLYCQDCLREHQIKTGGKGKDKSKCYECGEVYKSAKEYMGKYISPEDRAKNQRMRKENSDFSWIKTANPLPPSTKLLALKAQVTQWLGDSPEEKIVIYTQFIPILLCLKRICGDENWGYRTYYGGMSLKQRDRAIYDFINDSNVKILLSTLKAGGMGLNLVCASKVISLDPWWNFAVDNQAFCRIFRIKQERETTAIRIIVKDTIDDNLIKMQQKKSLEIDKALNDDGSMRRLSLEDLLSLFGDVRREADGTPFVVPLPRKGYHNLGSTRGREV